MTFPDGLDVGVTVGLQGKGSLCLLKVAEAAHAALADLFEEEEVEWEPGSVELLKQQILIFLSSPERNYI